MPLDFTALPSSARPACLAGLFGVDAEGDALTPPIEARRPIEALPARGIVLLTGPSGAGKSTLFHATLAAERARSARTIITVDESCAALPRGEAIITLLGSTFDDALRLFARAGLAEAGAMARSVEMLSVGQRARLGLARAIDAALRSPRPALIAADEFLATLDRLTARAVALGLRRWVDRLDPAHPGLTLLLATSHEDLAAALRPDLHLHITLAGEVLKSSTTFDADESRALGGDITLAPGTIEHYHALAHFHYQSKRPATIAAIDRALFTPTDGGEPILAGVVVRSRPGLGGAARRLALGARYDELPRTLRGRAINHELTTISRVIVDPRFRGLGLAQRLARHVLAPERALTPYTEAFARMGHMHPFFERAGMIRCDPPPDPAGARFIAVLEHAGIAPWLIAQPRAFSRCLDALTPAHRRLIEREIARLTPKDAPRHRRQRLLSAVFGRPVYYLAHHPSFAAHHTGG